MGSRGGTFSHNAFGACGSFFAIMNPQSSSLVRLEEVAQHLKISERHLRRLQSQWRSKRLMKPGKHYTQLGPRCTRYNLEAMLSLAMQHGYYRG